MCVESIDSQILMDALRNRTIQESLQKSTSWYDCNLPIEVRKQIDCLSW
jgi:hypothetical protein